MPKFLNPRTISAHRIAAVALYRALLTQSCKTPFPPSRQIELQNLIKYRFKQWQYEQSTKRLRIAFRGAYEALEKLDASVAGDNESTKYINELLERVGEKHKQPYPGVQPKLKTSVAHDYPQRSILDRPRPLSELTGRRHVPRLINACGIPVLRIKKPQPESLSAYISSRRRKKQQHTDLRHRLEDQIPLAQSEDLWDKLVSDGRSAQEETWEHTLEEVRQELQSHINAGLARDAAMAERMQNIVDEERILVKRERNIRRRTAEKARKAQQKAKDGVSALSMSAS